MFYGIIAVLGLSAAVFGIVYSVYSKKYDYTKTKNAVISLFWSFYSVMAVYLFAAEGLMEEFVKFF